MQDREKQRNALGARQTLRSKGGRMVAFFSIAVALLIVSPLMAAEGATAEQRKASRSRWHWTTSGEGKRIRILLIGTSEYCAEDTATPPEDPGARRLADKYKIVFKKVMSEKEPWDFVICGNEENALRARFSGVHVLDNIHKFVAEVHASHPKAKIIATDVLAYVLGNVEGGTKRRDNYVFPRYIARQAGTHFLPFCRAVEMIPVEKNYWCWLKTETHRADSLHPNFRAQYLLASCLYAAITGKSPVGLTHEMKTFPCSDTKFGIAFTLSKAEAKVLQEAAWKAVCEEKRLAKLPDYGKKVPGKR